METRLRVWQFEANHKRPLMYKIIGADGQPYGPVSADQLRRWIAEYRVNAQTLAQAEGSQEWKPLGSFAEFAELSKAAPPPAPGATPGPSRPGAEELAEEILAADYTLDIGSCLARSWGLLTRHFWLIVGASFVLWLIAGAVGGLLAGVCMGGLYFLLLKLIRGERAEFGDAFGGFSLAFLHLFLAWLVSVILVTIGLAFCILPGIYLVVAWVFAVPLVIDKRFEFWEAMELSRKVVTRHWWLVLGLLLVNLLVLLLGVAACVVGAFIAHPIAYGAIAYAYEDIFGRLPPSGAQA